MQTGAGPVTPVVQAAEIRRALADFDFAAPRPLDAVLAWTIEQLTRGLVHVTNPRYFGLFNPAPSFPAQCADRISAVFNPQLATATTSPAAVEIEAHVIRAVASQAGFGPRATGHFTNGGSEANYTALICALTRAHPEFAEKGSRAFSGAPMLYVSRDSHLAWFKLAHQAGIGRAAVQMIATDGRGRMDVGNLAAAITADRAAGAVPVMIAATAGTTNAGMIDPLPGCAELAQRERLWFHVDAAWGGAVMASPRHRHLLGGLEQADSATIDAHKWFATTMGCGMFLTQVPGILSQAFHAAADFMPSNEAGRDPYVTTLQWSRRFLGLRLFLALAVGGWPAYAVHVERAIALSRLIHRRLTERGWTIVNASPLAVLCAVPPQGSCVVPTLVRRVVGSGRIWIATTRFEGRDTARICVTHGESTEREVDELVAALADAARA